MTTITSDVTVSDEDAAVAGGSSSPRSGTGSSSATRRLWHPLTAILAVQTSLSLALIWSNTAYIDEADYLWVGHMVIRGWLHDAPWPVSQTRTMLSGSPVIYPPIGALADDVAGLAGARILSMLFMLAATVLLYSAASKIIGREGAVIAAALWAVSEPALRLAYATYDPLSVLMTTISAWLIVEAAHRRHRIMLAALSVVMLALANATAYSGIVIDPIVVAFAFLVWWPAMGARRALAYSTAFAGSLVGGFALVMVVTGSWAGTTAVFNRQTHDHESLTLVLNEIWGYSGLIIALALLGVIIAARLETRQQALLLALLGCAVFVAPVAQFHYGTAWSADKHVAYGFWFASMAAGYACAKLIAWPARARPRLVAVGCIIALLYPAVYGFQEAWQRYHLWQNSAAFIDALRPILAKAPQNRQCRPRRGPPGDCIYVPGHETNIAEYYLPQGRDWSRWSAALALDPRGLPVPKPRSQWPSYYANVIQRYSVLTLFYNTSFTSGNGLLAEPLARGTIRRRDLLNLVGESSNEAGVPVLTRVLENSRHYRLEAWGPYNINNLNGTHSYGIFAIWMRV
jgi:hypothetical protein